MFNGPILKLKMHEDEHHVSAGNGAVGINDKIKLTLKAVTAVSQKGRFEGHRRRVRNV